MGTISERLAIDGGTPVRTALLPYGRQTIEDADVAAVEAVLRGDWLTTGPTVAAFEEAFADFVGARFAVAVNSGTAALHAMMFALGIGPGDEVIVPAITFAATANAALYLGARPVFADVEPDTLLLDPASAAALIGAKTKLIAPVDYAGHPADHIALSALTAGAGITLAADACHALGAEFDGRRVGSIAKASAFSFHPVKPLTTAEGGMVATDDPDLAERMRWFRNHGITTDQLQRQQQGAFAYDMAVLGYNYRLSDLQCALGLAQLPRVHGWTERRRRIAALYDTAFADGALPLAPLAVRPGVRHAYHLYVVRLDLDRLTADRARIFAALRAEGIGVNVHYRPVYLHSHYRGLGYGPGLCPQAEQVYEAILSLPIFPAMTDDDAAQVVLAMGKVLGAYRR